MATPLLGAPHSRRARFLPAYGLSTRQSAEAWAGNPRHRLALVILPSLRKARNLSRRLGRWRIERCHPRCRVTVGRVQPAVNGWGPRGVMPSGQQAEAAYKAGPDAATWLKPKNTKPRRGRRGFVLSGDVSPRGFHPPYRATACYRWVVVVISALGQA